MSNVQQDVCVVVRDVLALEDGSMEFDTNTALLGAIPEFDSMAVVSIITALEDEFGCGFEDDEINAEVFATIGTLTAFVESKLS